MINILAELKYGAFCIKNGIGHWNGDAEVAVKMVESPSLACQWEGLWNPGGQRLKSICTTAISGLCIWGKYDCVFKFERRGKGNSGAVRSLSNPKDRTDLIARLKKGHQVERIIVSGHPFGLYQSKMIAWQADTVRRFGVKKLYYALPLEEYSQTFEDIKALLPQHCVADLLDILNTHYRQLQQKIEAKVEAEVDFIHPLRLDTTLSVEDSYVWPYQNLDIDLGIEEMEEVRIPYQALKNGTLIPPILLGMLGMPSPYYERRDDHKDSNYLNLFP